MPAETSGAKCTECLPIGIVLETDDQTFMSSYWDGYPPGHHVLMSPISNFNQSPKGCTVEVRLQLPFICTLTLLKAHLLKTLGYGRVS
jgi:hypothetical protein